MTNIGITKVRIFHIKFGKSIDKLEYSIYDSSGNIFSVFLLTWCTQVLSYVARYNKTHRRKEKMQIGSRKSLRQLEAEIKDLEAKVDELSKKMEAQEKKESQIVKTVSLAAELLTIIASLIAIVDFLS